MYKRTVSLLLAVLCTISLLSGCGGKSVGTTEPAKSKEQVTTETKAEAPEAPEYINLMTPWALPQEILDKYKEKTGTEVKMDVVPGSQDKYKQARNARMASGQEMDIIAVSNGPDQTEFPQKGTVLELTNEPWTANFTDGALNLMRKISATPDKLFYAVYEGATFGVWYNKDMFKKYSIKVPDNYEEFIEACETLKKNGIAPLAQGIKDIWCPDQEANLMMEPVYNKVPKFWIEMYTGKLKWTDKVILDEAKKLEMLYPSKGYYIQGVLSTSYDQCWQLMLQKKIGMWIMGSWAVEVMTKSNVKPDFGVGVFNPPYNYKGNDNKFSPKMGDRCYAVLTSSKKQDAAKDFLGFMTQKEIAQIYADKGMTISTVKDVASGTLPAGEDWAAILALPTGGQTNLEKVDTDGTIYNRGPEVDKIKDTNWAKVFAGNMTIEQYLEEMQKAQEKDIAAKKK
jgi:ABC-type sugar transport system, periplasmic component